MNAHHVQRGISRAGTTGRGPIWLRRGIAFAAGCGLWLSMAAASAGATDLDLGDVEALLRSGQYDECAKKAAEEIHRGLWSERWVHLKIRAELARGKATAALASLEEGLKRFPASVALHLLGREVYRANGREEEA